MGEKVMNTQYDIPLNEIFIKLFHLDIISYGFEDNSLFSKKVNLDANDILLLIFNIYKTFGLSKNCFYDLVNLEKITFNNIARYLENTLEI